MANKRFNQNGVYISPNPISAYTYEKTPTFGTSTANMANLYGRLAEQTINNKKTQPPKTNDDSWMNSGRITNDKDRLDMINAGLNVPSLTQKNNVAPAGYGTGGGGVRINGFTPYNSPYQAQIDALMQAIMNRGPFSYDYLSDPMYQSYRQQYEVQGDRARENAIGDYAANTGGLASSWATTAGQLTQNNYNAQLNGLIPELQNARYNKYLGEIETDFNKLNRLNSLENARYNRWLNERDYDYRLQAANASGSGGSRQQPAEDLSYRSGMFDEYLSSGLSARDYIRKNPGAFTVDDMNALATFEKNMGAPASANDPRAWLAGNGADGAGSKASNGYALWNYQLGNPDEEYEKRRKARLGYARSSL